MFRQHLTPQVPADLLWLVCGSTGLGGCPLLEEEQQSEKSPSFGDQASPLEGPRNTHTGDHDSLHGPHVWSTVERKVSSGRFFLFLFQIPILQSSISGMPLY